MIKRTLLIIGTLALTHLATDAAIVKFKLVGKAGSGLLPGNENHVVTNGGTGGMGPAGITYDTVTNILSLDVDWGSGNGFSDLSGDAVAAHIHGITPSSGSAAFHENAGVLYNLAGILDGSATSGGINGDVAVAPANEAALLNGQTYINVHTERNGPGEIRGQLVAVPEPAWFGALLLPMFLVFRRRRD